MPLEGDTCHCFACKRRAGMARVASTAKAASPFAVTKPISVVDSATVICVRRRPPVAAGTSASLLHLRDITPPGEAVPPAVRATGNA